MKFVKLSRPLFFVGAHYQPGQIVTLPDDVANQLTRSEGGEVVDGAAASEAANSDPLHAAKALGLVTDQHPGLVALNAPKPTAAPKPARGPAKPE